MADTRDFLFISIGRYWIFNPLFSHLNAFYLFLRSIWICFFQLVWKLNNIYLHPLICIAGHLKKKKKKHFQFQYDRLLKCTWNITQTVSQYFFKSKTKSQMGTNKHVVSAFKRSLTVSYLEKKKNRGKSWWRATTSAVSLKTYKDTVCLYQHFKHIDYYIVKIRNYSEPSDKQSAKTNECNATGWETKLDLKYL